MNITLVNGDSKPVEFFYTDDKMYVCPWCGYVADTGMGCKNPACWTAYKDIESLQAALNKEAKRVAEETERQKFLEIRNNSYGKRKSN